MRRNILGSLMGKFVRYDCVDEEVSLKDVFVDGLQKSVRLSMKRCLGTNRDAQLQSLGRYAMSLMNLEEGSNRSSTISRNDCYDQCRSEKSARSAGTTPNMSVQERQVYTSSFSYSKKAVISNLSRQGSSNQEKNHKPSKKS